MSKILTIGSVSQDIFFPTSEGIIIETPEDLLSQKKVAFELGAKYHINERFESLGGCSVNVAVGLAKLGEDVKTYTTIGDDATGKWIFSQLEKVGIDIEYVGIENDCKSDLSFILVDQAVEDRVIFSNQIANQRLVVDAQKISDADLIFIGDLSGNWQKNLDVIISIAKEKNIPLAFNPRQKTIHEDVEKIKEVIAVCDLLFVNKDEAREIVSLSEGETGNEEVFLIKELEKLGARNVALTDGKRGAWANDGQKIFHVEAILRKTVDTTGAGDAFASGFFAAKIKGRSVADSLSWGIANSSNSIGQYGGQAGLLTLEQIESASSKVSIKSIN